MKVTHFYFGPTPQTRYEHSVSEPGAYELIGANTVAGFEATRFTHNAAGQPLTTPDGTPLLVVTLTDSKAAISALAFVREAR
ncbi:hypothetical protein ACFU3J_16280 [Streptomyces sp. NPDC057411]|uniref:hypothetical protein n=1 Tax=unclassified Streptomyces TaxID=2593676 RepID=UPI00364097BF